MPNIHFDAMGMRPGTYSNNEEQWRKFVVDKAKAHAMMLANTANPPQTVPANTVFSVKLTFHLHTASIDLDIDNLSKCVLDSLFTPTKSCKYASGGMFAADDRRVWELALLKQVVAESAPQGVEIWVSW